MHFLQYYCLVCLILINKLIYNYDIFTEDPTTSNNFGINIGSIINYITNTALTQYNSEYFSLPKLHFDDSKSNRGNRINCNILLNSRSGVQWIFLSRRLITMKTMKILNSKIIRLKKKKTNSISMKVKLFLGQLKYNFMI